LDDGDIYEHFLKEGKSEEEALELAEGYGWTTEDRHRFSRIVGMYDIGEDRVTHHKCPECKKTIDLEATRKLHP
jgi:hypothetical protein